MASALFDNLSTLADMSWEKRSKVGITGLINLDIDITQKHLKISIRHFNGRDVSANFEISGLLSTFTSPEAVEVTNRAIAYMDSI